MRNKRADTIVFSVLILLLVFYRQFSRRDRVAFVVIYLVNPRLPWRPYCPGKPVPRAHLLDPAGRGHPSPMPNRSHPWNPTMTLQGQIQPGPPCALSISLSFFFCFYNEALICLLSERRERRRGWYFEIYVNYSIDLGTSRPIEFSQFIFTWYLHNRISRIFLTLGAKIVQLLLHYTIKYTCNQIKQVSVFTSWQRRRQRLLILMRLRRIR